VNLPKSFTTVSPLSKTLTVILFIALPFISFYLGIQHEKELNPMNSNQPSVFQNFFCKKWETICDPNSPNDASLGCAPKKICVDPSPTTTSTPVINTQKLKSACEQKEGVWREKYNECESMPSDKGLDVQQCESLGGNFNGCDSACRHNKQKNTLCPAVCVKVCKF
jgi:hypothetical protein